MKPPAPRSGLRKPNCEHDLAMDFFGYTFDSSRQNNQHDIIKNQFTPLKNAAGPEGGSGDSSATCMDE